MKNNKTCKTITIQVPKSKNKSKQKVATKNDWKIREMPSKTALFTYIIKFNFRTNKHMVTVNRNKR